MTEPALAAQRKPIHFTPLPRRKARRAALVKNLLKENRLVDGEYAEQYAGGSRGFDQPDREPYSTNGLTNPMAQWDEQSAIESEFMLLRDSGIAPAQPLLQEYVRSPAEIRSQDFEHELELRTAFENFLADSARFHGWTLISEPTATVGIHTIRPDGRVRDG